MKKFIIQSLIGTTLILTVACEARADVQIVKPDQPVAGKTQLFWAQAWFQWLFSIPDAPPHGPVWVQDGYWIMLNNLSLGKHTLHFHAEIPRRSS
jgi:hypothetical protein